MSRQFNGALIVELDTARFSISTRIAEGDLVLIPATFWITFGFALNNHTTLNLHVIFSFLLHTPNEQVRFLWPVKDWNVSNPWSNLVSCHVRVFRISRVLLFVVVNNTRCVRDVHGIDDQWTELANNHTLFKPYTPMGFI